VHVAIPPLPLLLFGAITGCNSTSEPNGDTGTNVPIELWLLRGDGYDLVVASRPLYPQEEIQQKATEDADWTTVCSEGERWMFTGAEGEYRWHEEGLEPVEATLTAAGIGFQASDTLSLSLPGDLAELTFTTDWGGADLFTMAVALQRKSDETWLEASCTEYDGESCWRNDESNWEVFPDGELPDSGTISFHSEVGEPRVEELDLQLLVEFKEEYWPVDSDSAQLAELGRDLAWGDLHSHTNLSFDGCEDPDNLCSCSGDSPGETAFAVAEENGLDFVAMTDHAEFETYIRDETGLTLDIHAETLAMAAQAEGGPVLPIVGYEWTGGYTDDTTGEVLGGHRTVLFESLTPCEEFWVTSGETQDIKLQYGLEHFVGRSSAVAGIPTQLTTRLEQAASKCGQTRYISYFHHPGTLSPIEVNWDSPKVQVESDVVVEIHSEQGCSECYDPDLQGCDWEMDPGLHAPHGSVQYALQLGRQLGFVGGTDNHESKPGSVEDGPGPILNIGTNPYIYHLTGGSLTGALYTGTELSRSALFDALEARNTLVASWPFDEVAVAALGSDGELYLPGSDVPPTASPLQLYVRLDDAAVDSWSVELLDPWNEIWVEAQGPCEPQLFDLADGEVRYVRLRAWVAEEEQRVWASPFFGQAD